MADQSPAMPLTPDPCSRMGLPSQCKSRPSHDAVSSPGQLPTTPYDKLPPHLQRVSFTFLAGECLLHRGTFTACCIRACFRLHDFVIQQEHPHLVKVWRPHLPTGLLHLIIPPSCVHPLRLCRHQGDILDASEVHNPERARQAAPGAGISTKGAAHGCWCKATLQSVQACSSVEMAAPVISVCLT